jgi:hypothetical protein
MGERLSEKSVAASTITVWRQAASRQETIERHCGS